MKNKYNKEELENLLINERKTCKEVGKLYNVSEGAIWVAAKRLGINLSKRKEQEETKSIIRICEYCGKEHDGSFGSGRFCCSECSHKYSSNTNKEERLNNISKSLKGRPSPLKGKKFGEDSRIHKLSKETKEKISKSLKNNPNLKGSEILKNYRDNESPEQKNSRLKKISETNKRLYKEGKIKGWNSRNKKSYAEKFWTKVLNNNNIEFISEKVVTKKELGVDEVGNYFLDFVINGNIDLEIDGKQHKYLDRAESDRIRDERLMKNGYIVYRIPFINPNTDDNKELVKKQIEDFLNWLSKHT